MTQPHSDEGTPAGAPQKTNTFAIVSLVSAFFVSLLGIIFGHIALSQIKKTGEGGRGLALAGTILGYVFTLAGLIAIIMFAVSTYLMATQLQDIDAVMEEFEQGQEQMDDSNPWDGTSVESFCDEYYGTGDGELDPEQHFTFLAENAPDAQLAEQFGRLAEIHGGDEEYSEALEAENQELLSAVDQEVMNVCM